MSDATTPPRPFPTPPSIEAAVTEHLNIVTELRELRDGLALTQGTLARLVEAQTVDRLGLGKLEKQFISIAQKVDTLISHHLALMEHLGMKPRG